MRFGTSFHFQHDTAFPYSKLYEQQKPFYLTFPKNPLGTVETVFILKNRLKIKDVTPFTYR